LVLASFLAGTRVEVPFHQNPVDSWTTGAACRYPGGMTVPVHLATRKRKNRQTGRDRAKVPTHASTNNGIHDHGFESHQTASTTAPAQTTGTNMLTTTSTNARTNPTPALITHEVACRMSPLCIA
jgi:hypothetical protein